MRKIRHFLADTPEEAILAAVSWLLQGHWCQGTSRYHSEGREFRDAASAVYKFCSNRKLKLKVKRILMSELNTNCLATWNDLPYQTVWTITESLTKIAEKVINNGISESDSYP